MRIHTAAFLFIFAHFFVYRWLISVLGGKIMVDNFFIIVLKVTCIWYHILSSVLSGCINLILFRLVTGWARIWPTKSTPRRTSLSSRRRRPPSVVASQIFWVSYGTRRQQKINIVVDTLFKNSE
jgi:hypothetical protein